MISFLQYFMIVVLVLLGLQTSAQSASEAAPLQEPGSISRSDYQSARQFQSLSRQWQNVVEADESNASAWLNWFEAERMANFENKLKGLFEEEKQELLKILEKMENSVPSSPQFQYANFLIDPYTPESWQYLLAAEEKSVDINDINFAMAAYGKITGSSSILKEHLKKIKSSEIFSQVEMEYNYNVLQSTPINGILFTHGATDTYPLLMWQELENVRKDVIVVNVEWLNNKPYRAQILEKTDLRLATSAKQGNYEWISNMIDYAGDRPVAITLTFNTDFIKAQSRDLYCTGLVFQTQPDPEMKKLEDNWSQFQLAHFDNSGGILKNYKVPLYLLNQHLAAKGQNDKRKSLEQFKEYFPGLFPAEK